MEGRVRYIVVAVVWIASLSAALLWFLSTQEMRLAIAAGPRDSESFQLASAIAAGEWIAGPDFPPVIFSILT